MNLICRPFVRVGVVNRGEAAVRFIRAARSWSARRQRPLEVVALYTHSDRDAMFVRDADHTVCLGDALVPGPDGKLRSAYLDIPRVVRLLKEAGCDAAWPGWGFVSERPEFVDACTEAGIVFIGPSGDSMRMLGDKIAAKALAEAHGVPVSDWSRGPVADAAEARAHAERIGFPVVLKAAAGGGGRGIRVVLSPDELEGAFASAAHEALGAFGDPTLLVEAFVSDARHVEVQIIADAHGRVHAAGTRDCSMQRRHQKVLEEAPAPLLGEALERALGEASVRLAKACGYVSAGTVEFLVHPETGRPCFLEMNTRLQVEHPVTECITGLDLVQAQIDIASGEALPATLPSSRGHAVEARLNAEDADDQFRPSAGRLLRFDLVHGPGLRVDTGFAAGDVVPSEFDSNIAKVIATGATREEAYARLREGLARLAVAIDGGASNRSLLLELTGHRRVLDAPVTTRWLDRYLGERTAPADRPHLDAALAAAAIGELERARERACVAFEKDAQRGIPTQSRGAEPVALRLGVGGARVSLEVAAVGPRRYLVASEGHAIEVTAEPSGADPTAVRLRGERVPITAVVTPTGLHVEAAGFAHRLERSAPGRVVAPMPGVVTAIHVEAGALVAAGDLVATLEIMKMEVTVRASSGGRVVRLLVDRAQRVAAGDPLLVIEAASDRPAEVERALSLWRDLPGARTVAHALSVMEALRAAVLGYTLWPATTQAALSELRLGRGEVSAAELIDLIDMYVSHERLFDQTPGADGVAPVDHLATYLRTSRAQGEGLPEPFLTCLRAALRWHGITDLRPSPALTCVVMRITQAHRALAERDGVLMAALEAFVALPEPHATPEPAEQGRRRELLTTLAALVGHRQRRLAGLAWSALAALGGPLRPPLEPREVPGAVSRELARLTDFDLEALPAPEGITLALARAKRQPLDARLVCVAEARAADLERVYLRAAYALRAARRRGQPYSPLGNELVLLLSGARPVSREAAREHIRALGPASVGAGIERVLVKGQGAGADDPPFYVVVSDPTGRWPTLTTPVEEPGPMAPRDPRRARVVDARRRGLTDPYELVRTLTAGESSQCPGRFTELELDAADRLVPVSREVGQNRANLVVGLVENYIETIARNVRRVLIVGDPTRSMGALGEPECRRLIAAFDLAEAERLPVEWVPVSSGARIAMDSGTENLDWTARVLARIVAFTQEGGTVNVLVDDICVGAQSYWNAEATMLQHCRGALVMTQRGAMLLTGKKALEFAGSVAAADNLGIGGHRRIMGPNGQAQYYAPNLGAAYALLLRHYVYTYVAPGERSPRRLVTRDPIDRDALLSGDGGAGLLRDLFDDAYNPGRKRPFAIRPLMRAVLDADHEPLERWADWHGAESAVVLEGSLGGEAICCIGVESQPAPRRGIAPVDGPEQWTSGTLFPLSSKKVARAINAASGARPVVVLANLSGFDGSPDSLRQRQLEYGAEIGRAVVNFKGRFIFCVVSRYHGGAFVVFSRGLNRSLQAVALQGAYASVIGGASAAAVVFPGKVQRLASADPRVVEAAAGLEADCPAQRASASARHAQAMRDALSDAQTLVAREFDAVHSVERALQVGSLDAIIRPDELRRALADRLQEDRWDRVLTTSTSAQHSAV